MTSDYAQSREKFNALDRVSLMRNNISEYTEPEWGFPKGRRMRGESDLACAIREFDEETNIPRDAFQPETINLTQKLTPVQRREISGIGWKTFEEAEALVRPHHVERKNMLQQLQSVIETFECE
jgi:8-oxo-dGTP pyrophosphatase MutT (NUDIX family)